MYIRTQRALAVGVSEQYLSIDHATATIMQQAEEATRAMSEDIPDLKGAELKI